MLSKQIEAQEVNLARHQALLDEEVKSLQTYLKGAGQKGFSVESRYDVDLAIQADNIATTIVSISKKIARHESNVKRHKEIIKDLNSINNPSIVSN